MDTSSFRGFLRKGKPTGAELAEWLQTALTGIARHTLDGSEQELIAFRDNIAAQARQISENANCIDVHTAVDQALELLRQYNERALKLNQSRIGEMKTVLRTMTETITYLSESRTRSVHQLQFMERELEQASQIDDIRLIRSRLVTCLDVVRDETVRLQTEAENRSNEVKQQMERAKAVEPPAVRFGLMDTVTGLPGRRSAERLISETLEQSNENALSIFVVKRLAAINSKFGRAVGDEVMLRVANHFAHYLSATTSLYRWSGPALLALTPVYGNAEEIKRSWAKAAAIRQEINLESKARTLFVVVEISMYYQVINKSTIAEDLFGSLDRFVADQPEAVLEEV